MKKFILIFIVLIINVNGFCQDMIGLYFNTEYIENLNQARIHQQSMKNSNNMPDAIQIKLENGQLVLMEIYNFHEGKNIRDNIEELFEERDNEVYVYTETDSKGIETGFFKKINDSRHIEDFIPYILRIIFDNKVFVFEEGIIRIRDNSILINDQEYEFVLSSTAALNTLRWDIIKNNERTYAINAFTKQIVEVSHDNIYLSPKNHEVFNFFDDRDM